MASVGGVRSALAVRRRLRDADGEWVVLHGHYSYGVGAIAGMGFATRHYVPILREPLDRCISHYYFILQSKSIDYEHPQRQLASKLSTVDFYRQSQMRNMASRTLSGVAIHIATRKGLAMSQERLAERALHVLESRYDFWGYFEDLETFADSVQLLLRADTRDKISGREKATRERPSVCDLSERDRAGLVELNHADCMLYERSKLLPRILPERSLAAMNIGPHVHE